MQKDRRLAGASQEIFVQHDGIRFKQGVRRNLCGVALCFLKRFFFARGIRVFFAALVRPEDRRKQDMLRARCGGKAERTSAAGDVQSQKRLSMRQFVHPVRIIAHERDAVCQRHVTAAVLGVPHRLHFAEVAASRLGVFVQRAVGICEHPDVDVARVARINKPQRGIEQCDGTGRMTGEVLDDQLLAAEVDLVAVPQRNVLRLPFLVMSSLSTHGISFCAALGYFSRVAVTMSSASLK